MKEIVILAVAVFVGIVIYRKLAGRVSTPTRGGRTDLFVGPDVDPQTGAYLPSGAMPGTVEFAAQDN